MSDKKKSAQFFWHKMYFTASINV